MSGHSKWANIKRKKEINDRAKSTHFSKLSRLITIAASQGGTDVENNFKLRMAIEKAKSFNMPKDNIARAIEKAAGGKGSDLKEVLYEGFAPAGIGLLIEATTDNPNRTSSEIRNVLDRNNAHLGVSGSVSYLFRHEAVVLFDKKQASEDEAFSFADSVGAYDIDETEDEIIVHFPYEKRGEVQKYSVEAHYQPISYIEVQDKNTQSSIEILIDSLLELEDVQDVSTNLATI